MSNASGRRSPETASDLPRWLTTRPRGSCAARAASSLVRQHFLYFTPEPHGQGPFLLGALMVTHATSACGSPILDPPLLVTPNARGVRCVGHPGPPSVGRARSSPARPADLGEPDQAPRRGRRHRGGLAYAPAAHTYRWYRPPTRRWAWTRS